MAQIERGMTMRDKYCFRCGCKLEYKKEYVYGFNPKTGKQNTHKHAYCKEHGRTWQEVCACFGSY